MHWLIRDIINMLSDIKAVINRKSMKEFFSDYLELFSHIVIILINDSTNNRFQYTTNSEDKSFSLKT